MTTLELNVRESAPASEVAPAAAPQAAKPKPPNIRRDVREDQICVLIFDRPESSANIFESATLTELNQHLDEIERASQIRGLVLASAKKTIFVAGADLHSLSTGVEAQALRSLIELGQSVFNRLAALRIPTVAAIHGACLGGGYELCLACQYRIASPDRSTKIGLPETQLGILPAWGGTTRLPRLIGLPKALDMILNGKVVPAKAALKFGMVNEVVPTEYLLDIACQRARQGRFRRSSKFLQNNALVVAAVRRHLRPRLLKKTRGHYPAILKALEVAAGGARESIAGSLALERDAILELAQTEACKNLIRVFFL